MFLIYDDNYFKNILTRTNDLSLIRYKFLSIEAWISAGYDKQNRFHLMYCNQRTHKFEAELSAV